MEEYIYRSLLARSAYNWCGFLELARYKLLQSRLCIDLSERFISKQWKNRTLAPILLLSFLSACSSNDYKNVFPHCCLSVPLILTFMQCIHEKYAVAGIVLHPDTVPSLFLYTLDVSILNLALWSRHLIEFVVCSGFLVFQNVCFFCFFCFILLWGSCLPTFLLLEDPKFIFCAGVQSIKYCNLHIFSGHQY